MKEYALYKGDEFIKIDTIENLAKHLKVTVRSAQFYCSPTYLKRTGGRGIVIIRVK